MRFHDQERANTPVFTMGRDGKPHDGGGAWEDGRFAGNEDEEMPWPKIYISPLSLPSQPGLIQIKDTGNNTRLHHTLQTGTLVAILLLPSLTPTKPAPESLGFGNQSQAPEQDEECSYGETYPRTLSGAPVASPLATMSAASEPPCPTSWQGDQHHRPWARPPAFSP